MGHFKSEIVNIPAYQAVGSEWSGSYKEIGELKKMISTMRGRVEELIYTVEPKVQLGVSYHLRRDGFVHYSVYEVSEATNPGWNDCPSISRKCLI
ncbi:GyrI-like domain-containing protein [Aquibacillus halophilus]|uniref:GyrI-like domain-containing protein n=1 Tax=Aquibacillus halophilus TaxID=930132 RepID=UPI001F0EA4DC|nr:GyrI-like domain-containing protein [Aquibacillus halophilus]